MFYFLISDRQKTSVLLFSHFGRNVFFFPVNNPKYAVKAVAKQIPTHCTAIHPLERNDQLHQQKSRYQHPRSVTFAFLAFFEQYFLMKELLFLYFLKYSLMARKFFFCRQKSGFGTELLPGASQKRRM